MSKYSLNRKVSALACAIATAIIGIDFSLGGKPASADVIDLTCPVGGETVTYSPGLTNTQPPTTATAKVDGSHTTCVSLSDPTIKSARYNFTLQVNTSCLDSSIPTSDIKYIFNNGQSSTVHYVTSQIVVAEGEIILTSVGTVTSGEFAGDMVTRTVTDTTLSPEQCATPEGVTSATGVTTLTFSR